MGKKKTSNEGFKSSKRRFSTECNYSILQTLLMKFLKEKNLYKQSQQLAEINQISKEKNYTIIVLRMTFFFYHQMESLRSRKQNVQELFQWLNNQLQECIQIKYSTQLKEFKRMVKKKVQEDLHVFRDVFQNADLSNHESIKNILVRLYYFKGNKKHSKTHEKCAGELAKYVQGIMKFGKFYIYPKKKLQNFQNTEGNFHQKQGCLESSLLKLQDQFSQIPLMSLKQNSSHPHHQSCGDSKRNMASPKAEENQEALGMWDASKNCENFLEQQELCLNLPFYLESIQDSSFNQLMEFQIHNQNPQRELIEANSVLKRPE